MAYRLIAAILAALVVSSGHSEAQLINYRLGNPNARVTVVEYAAITCPYCRDWEQSIWPDVYRRYVKTGIANFELRQSLAPEAQLLGEEAFIVARCAASNGGYFNSVEAFMRTMPARADIDGGGWLISGGRAGGLTDWQTRSCLSDRSNWTLFDQLKDMNMAALYAYGREHNLIMGLPSVFVNGVLVPGDATTPGVVARAIENAQ